METHKDFIGRVVAAPQDVCLPILQKFLRKGYDMTTWRTSASATDAPCISKEGDQMPLKQFISGLRHKAPIYEKTHVGCNCLIELTSTKNKKLPMVKVNAFGLTE